MLFWTEFRLKNSWIEGSNGSYSVILNFSCQNSSKISTRILIKIFRISYVFSLDTSSEKGPTAEKRYKNRKEELFRDLYGLREDYDLVIVGAGLSGYFFIDNLF